MQVYKVEKIKVWTRHSVCAYLILKRNIVCSWICYHLHIVCEVWLLNVLSVFSWPEGAAGKFLPHLQGKNKILSGPRVFWRNHDNLLRYSLDNGWNCFRNKNALAWVKQFAYVDIGVVSPENSTSFLFDPPGRTIHHTQDLVCVHLLEDLLFDGQQRRETDWHPMLAVAQQNLIIVEWITSWLWFIFYYQESPHRRVSRRYLSTFTRLSLPFPFSHFCRVWWDAMRSGRLWLWLLHHNFSNLSLCVSLYM